MNLSPGIIAMYWLLASAITATAWHLAVSRIKRGAHHATARCHCGTC